uniref:Uncharacterized protein n=1 Tax=Alexandrium monilatum TaxID=311494 RepID=A0A7S4PWU4_9DINO
MAPDPVIRWMGKTIRLLQERVDALERGYAPQDMMEKLHTMVTAQTSLQDQIMSQMKTLVSRDDLLGVVREVRYAEIPKISIFDALQVVADQPRDAPDFDAALRPDADGGPDADVDPRSEEVQDTIDALQVVDDQPLDAPDLDDALRPDAAGGPDTDVDPRSEVQDTVGIPRSEEVQDTVGKGGDEAPSTSAASPLALERPPLRVDLVDPTDDVSLQIKALDKNNMPRPGDVIIFRKGTTLAQIREFDVPCSSGDILWEELENVLIGVAPRKRQDILEALSDARDEWWTKHQIYEFWHDWLCDGLQPYHDVYPKICSALTRLRGILALVKPASHVI